MHDLDLANWRAVDSGERPVTWGDFIGDPEAAAYLTPAGRELSRRMAVDLAAFTRADWLPKVLGSGDTEGRFPWLGRFAPPLNIFWGDHGAAGAFVELVRWWAAFTSQGGQPGMGKVRRDLRGDVSIDRFLHVHTQIRLGAIATTLGWQVEYEPPRGDLYIGTPDGEVTIELFSMGTPKAIEDQHELADRMHAHLDDLGRRHSVYFHGDLPNTDTDLDAWRARAAADAATVSRLRFALVVSWDGNDMTIEPGDAPTGTELNGPTIEGEVGERLYKRARTKARQIESVENGWLWIENHGAIDNRSHIYYLPLAEQLDAFDGRLRPVIDEGPATLRGLTFSGAGRRRWPPQPTEEVDRSDPARANPDDGDTNRTGLSVEPAVPVPVSRASTMSLAIDRVRATIHLAGTDSPASRIMWQLAQSETSWLDATLASLGVAATVTELINQDCLRPTS